jgi:hypothetical protein
MSNFFERGYCKYCDGETEHSWIEYATGRFLVACENCNREVSEQQHAQEELEWKQTAGGLKWSSG